MYNKTLRGYLGNNLVKQRERDRLVIVAVVETDTFRMT